MRFPRSSGILAHVTSLPSEYGVGDFGPQAHAFVDWLASAGQSIWQVLPLNPPARGNSPYSCYSVFANNPILVSPERLVDQGWLSTLPGSTAPEDRVDFDAVIRAKTEVLEQAFGEAEERLASHTAFLQFCHRNAWWLDDFACYESMMRQFDSADWTTWPEDLAKHNDAAIEAWRVDRARSVRYSQFVQFILDEQWNALKDDANAQGIRMYGDLPIFVAHESADVWANQHLFCLDEQGQPALVAGVPPDYFSETGQRWGNPLYRWDVMESHDFAWWTKRFRRAHEQFDLLRVDHFRGFEAYWEIPASEATAVGGRWRKGPGAKPFQAANASLGELPIVAEDLGLITKEVHELRDQLGFPPMRVLQFGFDSNEDDFHHPDTYPEHSFAYSGTHDNDTTMGWYASRSADGSAELIERQLAKLADGSAEGTADTDHAVHLQFVKMVFESRADTAIVPLQDTLGLGNEARMNTPGTASGNWSWRVKAADLTSELASQLLEITRSSNR